ncbi:MAG: MerR family transcriptional regulator [Deltaproteobacteria bacterium]|jgi:DNA-binding transcriptional MerR regulator|nr:MerR family transcriptional regulator [Deltaproteobacteria bacterium]
MDERTFSLADLGTLTGLPRRTIRYYIQIGLVSRPNGEGRGAYYTESHLAKLLEVKKLTSLGLSLNVIKERQNPAQKDLEDLSPLKVAQEGAVRTLAHIKLAKGLALIVDPLETRLSPEEVDLLVEEISKVIFKIQNPSEEPDSDSQNPPD